MLCVSLLLNWSLLPVLRYSLLWTCWGGVGPQPLSSLPAHRGFRSSAAGTVWHRRWAGDRHGLPRPDAGPHPPARVRRHPQHVLELPRLPGGGQQREWHRLGRLLPAPRWPRREGRKEKDPSPWGHGAARHSAAPGLTGQGSRQNAGQSRPSLWPGRTVTSLPSLCAESLVWWLGPPLVFLDAGRGWWPFPCPWGVVGTGYLVRRELQEKTALGPCPQPVASGSITLPKPGPWLWGRLSSARDEGQHRGLDPSLPVYFRQVFPCSSLPFPQFRRTHCPHPLPPSLPASQWC